MSIFSYALMSYGLMAAISLAVVGIIVGISKLTGGSGGSAEEDKA
jgi:hypothetical protein